MTRYHLDRPISRKEIQKNFPIYILEWTLKQHFSKYLAKKSKETLKQRKDSNYDFVEQI